MDYYITLLLASELPFPPWVAAVIWVALFVANHWAARSARAANDAQTFFTIVNSDALRRSREPRFIAAQVLFAGVVFLFGLFLGGPAFVFLGGGIIVAMAYALALNAQGLISARALADPNVGTGTLTFSTAWALRHMGHRAAGGAFACLAMGLALAHLALLGGALFLGSTAGGYLRRARSARVQT